MIVRENIIRKLAGWLCLSVMMTVAVIAFVGCESGTPKAPASVDITENNLQEVCDCLRNAGLDNVDIFESWVQDYLTDSQDEDDGAMGFTDADCRMTVMLLAGGQIKAETVKKKYAGTYLMFDVDAIDNDSDYEILRDKKKLFTTLFGEMPIPDRGFADAFPSNLEKYGIRFEGEKFSVISLVCKAYDEEEAFVGHTGILADCSADPKADSKYLYIEKIAFSEPFKVTKINDVSELVALFSSRPEYTADEGEPKARVYMDEEFIGELTE